MNRGSAGTKTQMVWPWKLQSSHFDSSNIFQNVLSHSPVSSFFSLIQSATCIMRRGISQSLHNDSTLSSSSRGRDVLLKRGPHASLSLQHPRQKPLDNRTTSDRESASTGF